jgi:hypothetical protein
LGALFYRCSIRDNCRQSASFESIAARSTTSRARLSLGHMLGDIIMSLSEKSFERKLQFSSLSDHSFLATVAVCFVVLHVLAIAMLISVTRNDAGATPAPPALSSQRLIAGGRK